jgi:hypothetical protein
MDPNWIVAISALAYTVMTALLILEQRRSRIDDKFPCIVVRSIRMPVVRKDGSAGREWTLRLVNVGRGPAFIDSFRTEGLRNYGPNDGDNTAKIDKVIGPDMGDPYLHVEFAEGSPTVLQRSDVKIVINYRDIAGRLFESGIREGKPFSNLHGNMPEICSHAFLVDPCKVLATGTGLLVKLGRGKQSFLVSSETKQR